MGEVDKKLKELGINIPNIMKKPEFSFIPAQQVGNLIYVSGQDSRLQNGELIYKGKLGNDLTIAQGHEASRQCAINVIGAIKSLVGDLDKVTRVVKLLGFVNSSPGFADQPYVMNGASDLFYDVFGERGIHARSAIGVNELPFDTPVEIEMIVEISHSAS